MEEITKACIIDAETGEKIKDIKEGDTVKVITKTQKEALLKKKLKDKMIHSGQASGILGESFIFIICKSCEPFLKEKAITEIDLTRLVFLSTFANYENKLMMTQKTPMSNARIQAELGLSSKTYYDFLRRMTNLGLIKKEEKVFYLCNSYFKKGRIKYKKEVAVKNYTESMRHLYYTSSTTQKTHLGYLLRLMPYLNYEINSFSSTPNEADISKIKLLSRKDLQEILGIANQTMYKMMTSISTLSLPNEEALLLTVIDGLHGNKRIIINPYFLNRSSNPNTIEAIAKFFQNED